MKNNAIKIRKIVHIYICIFKINFTVVKNLKSDMENTQKQY